jgi:hypothetical protein
LHLFSFFNDHDSQLLSSCILLSQLLSCLTKIFSVFPFISILSLSSEILSFTCSSLQEWPSTVFLVWLKWLFFQNFCLILCSEVLHIFGQLLL